LNTASLPLVGSSRWLPAVAATVAACALLWASVSAHLQQACVVRDTPYLPLCDDRPASPLETQQKLQARITRNPGDSWTWVRLLVSQESARNAPVLEGATALAPHHSNVLRRRAAAALQGGRLDEGVALLVQMLQHRNNAEAAQVMARLAATPEGSALLRPHLPEARHWLPAVLSAMRTLKIPSAQALPLVAQAMQQGTLAEDARRAYMRSLKAEGAWVDAYGLWLARHAEVVPLLYNGGFDAPFEPDGFDWEYTPGLRSRAGVLVDQHPLARRGMVLELEFTGRSFSRPIVRQYVFAPPGSYRLRGEYTASKLRSEGGLVWHVVCASTGTKLPARTQAMQDTGGLWKPVALEFAIPPDCGPVASVQLEPVAAFEGTAGFKGRVELDGFGLARIAN
jgi:hypothetical protein